VINRMVASLQSASAHFVSYIVLLATLGNVVRTAAKWTAVLLVIQPIIQPTAGAESKRQTVVDYFLRMQVGSALEVSPKDLVANMDVVDIANGYLHVVGDGAQASLQVALFRYTDDRPLLAVYLESDPEVDGTSVGCLSFWELGPNGKMKQIADHNLPYREQIDGVKMGIFKLPQKGNTIAVLDSQGRVRSRYAWNGTSFQLASSKR
jgi:hypothetical protein